MGIASSLTLGEVCGKAGITPQTYYRWRYEYGGMKLSQSKRLKELQSVNSRLKRAVADLTLDKLVLKEALEENSGLLLAPPVRGAPSRRTTGSKEKFLSSRPYALKT